MRYDLRPLLAAHGGSHREVAEAIGIEHVSLRKAIERGLSDRIADRWACALGYHPSLVWPSWFDDALKVRCACIGCAVWFLPEQGRRAHRRYCSPRCKNRQLRRQWLAKPGNRERHREERRRYYHEVEKRAA